MSCQVGHLLRFGGKECLRSLPNYPCWAGNLRGLSTSAQMKNLLIDVSPKEGLLDNPPVIRIEGCKSKQKLTLCNSYVDDSGFHFSSHAHYIANDDGVVDLKYDASHGGKFKGVFAEGLMYTMHTVPSVYENKPKLKWARLYKKDVTQPMKYTLKVADGHLSEEELHSSKEPNFLGEQVFLRHLMGNGVRRIEIEENGVLGTLFLPPGNGPFPLVLDLFGAESGIKEFRSAMLASYGYASFVLPYYSFKSLPILEDRLNLDYFLKAIDYLTNLPQAAGGRIGIVGSSKGGEIGLTLAGLTDKIKACITINSYHRSIDVNYFLNDELFLVKTVVDEVCATRYVNKKGHLIARGKTHFYHWDVPGALPIEKIPNDCKVLIAAGDEDGGHSYESAMGMRIRAFRYGKENISTIIYPRTGHLIDPPFHSHIEAVWNSVILVRKPDGTKYKGLPHFYGGKPYETCLASKDLWERILRLLHEKLVQEGGLSLQTAKMYPPY